MKLLILLTLVTITLVISVISNDKPSTTSQPALTPQEKVSPDAVFLMDKKNFPRVYKKWGEKRVKEINELMPVAALKVAASPSCDKVAILGLSEMRSVAPSKAVFYADCDNGERFYISESEIATSKEIKSKSEITKSITDSSAIQECENKVKATLALPSSFKRDWTTTSVYRAPTGNIVASFSFSAKNRIGNSLNQNARCVIDDRGMQPVEISF